MKGRARVLVALLGPTIALWPAPVRSAHAAGTTYYVDPAPAYNCRSRNAGPGTSPERPWCSVGTIAKHTFAAGDSILLRRGATWTKQAISLYSSGAPGAFITLGSYGSGPLPRLIGPGPTPPPLLTGSTGVSVQDADYIRIKDLHIEKYDLGVSISVSDGFRREGFRLENLLVHGNEFAIYLYGGAEAASGGLVDVRIDDVEAYGNGSDTPDYTSPYNIYCQPGAFATGFGSTLVLSNVHGAVIHRLFAHDDLDSALGLGGGTSDVVLVSSHFDGENVSYQCSGTIAAYLTDVARVWFVNDVIARTFDSTYPNPFGGDDYFSGDQGGIDTDTDVDDFRLLGSFLGGNAGPGLEILQNGTEPAAPEVRVEGNVFADNAVARREHGSVKYLGGIMQGFAAPSIERPVTGTIADNLHYEPTGFTYVCCGTYGFSHVDMRDNIAYESALQLHHAGEDFSCIQGSRGWSYVASANGQDWTDLTACAQQGDGPTTLRWTSDSGGWVGRFDAQPPASGWIGRAWTAPSEGVVEVRGHALLPMAAGGPNGAATACAGDGVRAEVRLNVDPVPLAAADVTPDPAGVGLYARNVQVHPGDVLYFAVANLGTRGCDELSWSAALAFRPAEA